MCASPPICVPVLLSKDEDDGRGQNDELSPDNSGSSSSSSGGSSGGESTEPTYTVIDDQEEKGDTSANKKTIINGIGRSLRMDDESVARTLASIQERVNH